MPWIVLGRTLARINIIALEMEGAESAVRAIRAGEIPVRMSPELPQRLRLVRMDSHRRFHPL